MFKEWVWQKIIFDTVLIHYAQYAYMFMAII